MSEYAYIQTRPETGSRSYYHADVAVGHSCSDEAHENPNRYNTIICWWGDDD